MTQASPQEITHFALEEAVRLTGSQIGYVGFMDEEETTFTVHSWSRSVMEQCEMNEEHVVFPLSTTGLLVEAVRQRKPIITNDYLSPNPLKKGFPPGHVPIYRHLSVPVFDGQRMVAMAGVANKQQDYEYTDTRQLTLLMQGMWRLLQGRQAEEQLQAAHDQLETRVLERTAELQAANAALREEMDRRRTLERELMSISALEQQRIGQELHDGLGQELTGLGYLAESLYTDLQSRDAIEAADADELAGGIQAALDRARAIARGLVPLEVHPDGLAPALQQLAATVEERYGIPCKFRCEDAAPLENAAVGQELLRIAQEAVNNAGKHAGASHIDIELEQDANRTTIHVRDDGVGISAESGQANGIGLRTMQYRAALLGASLEVGTVGDYGTCVTCVLECPNDQQRQTGTEADESVHHEQATCDRFWQGQTQDSDC